VHTSIPVSGPGARVGPGATVVVTSPEFSPEVSPEFSSEFLVCTLSEEGCQTSPGDQILEADSVERAFG